MLRPWGECERWDLMRSPLEVSREPHVPRSQHLPIKAPLRSLILVCLILFLMRSFWILLWSALPHQIGRLYSHLTFKLTQAPQEGCFSSHFFRRRRHVKQPVRGDKPPLGQPSAQCHPGSHVPERDRLCNLAGVLSTVPDEVPSLPDGDWEQSSTLAGEILTGGVFLLDAAGMLQLFWGIVVVKVGKRTPQAMLDKAVERDRTQSLGERTDGVSGVLREAKLNRQPWLSN